MRVGLKLLLLASALLLAGLPTLATEETPNVVPMAAPTAVVKCPGVTSIPYTADEEQALPMHLVGSLSCGETVVVLSDLEGYTAHIRTKDGREGFVARMYLTADSGTPAPVEKPKLGMANTVNGVARWEAGAPGCIEFMSHGRHVESISANGITVQVSLQDSGWKYRANVAISNQTTGLVEVLPAIITLDELMPNLKPLPATSSEKVAHTQSHQVLWTAADAVPSPSVVASHSTSSANSEQLTYRISDTPDYLNPHMALASTKHVAFSRNETVDVQAIALKSLSLPVGQKTSGVMWFNRDANARELSLRVPVGETVFDFAFSLDQKK
jgi:hypothetical protein